MRRRKTLFALAAPAAGLFALGCAPDGAGRTDDDGRMGEAPSALSHALVPEREPNGAAASATPIPVDGVATADILPLGDEDFFSFRAVTGDRVYAATATAFSPSSPDTVLELIAPDGTTVLESDNDNGSLAGQASSVAGTLLTETGTHYLRVRQSDGVSTIRPYHLHLETQVGTPVPETEPNDTTPQPLPASRWVSGAIDAAGDVDVFTLSLNAGDTVFASLDLDPDRDGTELDGALSMGPFAGTFLSVDDAGGPGPDSEALFVTVKTAGTYAIGVDAPGGGTGNYHLSVGVHPAPRQGSCATYTSTVVPLAIPAGPGVITSTLTVPDNPRVADIDLTLRLHHASPRDLDIALQSPAGTQAVLFSDVGSSAYPSLDLTLDDEAAFPVSATSVLDGLIVQPESTARLDWFDGQDAGGTWTLRIADDSPGKGGTLEGWSLTVCEPPPAAACPFGAATTLLSADFEANDGGFTHGGTADTWAWGTPAQAPDFTGCNGGTRCFKTSLDGDYEPSSNQDLVSPPIDLAGKQGPIVVRWAMKHRMENASFDQAWVEVREVGGGAASRLWQWTGPSMTGELGDTEVQTVAGWGTYTADVRSYAGKTIQLVFHVDADMSTQYPGLAIDDVEVTACPAQVCGNGSVEGTEECDDGDLASGDGCSETCTIEGQGGAGGAGGTGGTGGTGGAGGPGGSSASGGSGGTAAARVLPQGGCGCGLTGAGGSGPSWAAGLAFLGLGLLRVRRRRARS